MRPCRNCGEHILMTDTTCPHCNSSSSTSSKPSVSKTSVLALGMLLGIGSVGCGEDDKDTAGDDTATEEPASEPDMAAEYGVPSVEDNP